MSRNVALRLAGQARIRPNQIAIASPTGSHRQGTSRSYERLGFRDLDERTSSIAAGLQAMGVGPGKKMALLVRFGADFIALVFAVLKTGATLVLIDPGMGKKNLVRCLSAVEPDGFIAIPAAHIVRSLCVGCFSNAKLNVTVGRRMGFLPSPTLDDLEKSLVSSFRPPESLDSDSAAIIFTTGSTGPPKGVHYTHGTFNHQIDQLVERYGIQSGGVDLSCFPLFGLFNAVMGTTTILPDMNPIRPADVDPPRLLDAIEQWSINQAFGSPALWTKVGGYCDTYGRKLPSLKLILSAGAPVSPRILRSMRAAMAEEGRMYTPYGATEALPVASIESREVLGETANLSEQGRGTCVGTRFSGIEWRVIAIDDRPLPRIEDTKSLPAGGIGELMVSGPVVSREYVTRLDQNPLHKVVDGDRIWHRMGDVGYLDESERFWYCGRKSHRVRTRSVTLYTEPCEAVFNTHPLVHRSALVGIGEPELQRAAIVIEPWSDRRPLKNSEAEKDFLRELRKLSESNCVTEKIEVFHLYPGRLPTDIRHNSKIFREKIVPWATKRTKPIP
jgi:acyl-CoA synthetase (AMP-forming)/AMP-acid ligase II